MTAKGLSIQIAALVFTTGVVQADEEFKDLDTYVKRAVQQWRVPGLAIASDRDQLLPCVKVPR